MKSLRAIREELNRQPFITSRKIESSSKLKSKQYNKNRISLSAPIVISYTEEDIEEIEGKCDFQNDVLFSCNKDLPSKGRLRSHSTSLQRTRSDSCGSPLWTGSESEDTEEVFNDSPDSDSTIRRLSNSTSSLYIDSTLHSPNTDDVTKSIALALYYHLEAGHLASVKPNFEIFNENKYPLTKRLHNLNTLPTPTEIISTLNKIFMDCLPVEVGILGLAFVERLIAKSKITIHACNYRRVVLSCVMLACKVWEDKAVWNADFCSVFSKSTTTDMRNLENSTLYLLNYDVEVTGKLYAKYYFKLRQITESEKRDWPLKPLDKHSAKALHERSHEQSKMAKRQSSRAQSSGRCSFALSRKVLN